MLPPSRALVPFGLLNRLPPEGRHELVLGRAFLGGASRSCLAPPVCRAVIKPGLIAPLAHLVPEAVGRERLAVASPDRSYARTGRRQSRPAKQAGSAARS